MKHDNLFKGKILNDKDIEPEERNIQAVKAIRSTLHYVILLVKTHPIVLEAEFAVTTLGLNDLPTPDDWSVGIPLNQLSKIADPVTTIVHGTVAKAIANCVYERSGITNASRAGRSKTTKGNNDKDTFLVIPVARISSLMNSNECKTQIAEMVDSFMIHWRKLPSKMADPTDWHNEMIVAVSKVQEKWLIIIPSQVITFMHVIIFSHVIMFLCYI